MKEEAVRSLLAGVLQRPSEGHKYTFGHVLVVGGSEGMSGASLLAGLAALRGGAGLVTVTSVVADSLAGRVPELMTMSLADYSLSAVQRVVDFVQQRNVHVGVIGPGLGPEAVPFVHELCLQLEVPLILDAGALMAFKGQLDVLRRIAEQHASLILTPHAGEYQRLSGINPGADRQEMVRELPAFAREYGVTVVLKGSHTVVASPEAVYENLTGNPGLATAGTGDVLSGVIAALIGQGLEPFPAACAGVYLHGLAADIAVGTQTQPGLIASDVIAALPAAYQRLS